MRYFPSGLKVDNIKKIWRKLAFQNHPDIGGDTATMQDINNQYLEALKGQHKTIVQEETETEKERKYYYNEKVEKEVMEKVLQLLGLKMADVDILLLGTWIWIEGDTKPYKSILGKGTEEKPGAKCRWHSKKQCWYWRSAKNKCYTPGNKSLSGIAATYGYQKFDSMEQLG